MRYKVSLTICIVFGLGQILYSQNIPDVENITKAIGTDMSSKEVSFSAVNITASNSISKNATVEYIATNSIKLRPGFQVSLGAEFHAGIDISGLKENVLTTTQQVIMTYPNPFNNIFNIEYSLETNTYVLIKVIDHQGKIMAMVVDEEMVKGKHTSIINSHHFDPGIYYYSIVINGKINYGKIIKQ